MKEFLNLLVFTRGMENIRLFLNYILHCRFARAAGQLGYAGHRSPDTICLNKGCIIPPVYESVILN